MSLNQKHVEDIPLFIETRDFSAIRQLLIGLPHADAAELLQHLSPVQMAVSFRLLPKTAAAEIFEYIDADHQESLIRALGDNDAAGILNAMSDDDRTAFLEECPEHAVQLLALLDPAQQRVALQLLGYPENSVGRMMTTKFVSIHQDWTIHHALEHIRDRAKDVYYVHVVCSVDETNHLLGVHRIRDIFLADPKSHVRDLPSAPPLFLKVTDTQEHAVKTFRKYSRTIIPVVNGDTKVVGIVTVDDVLETATEEAARDIASLGAVEVPEEPLLRTPLYRLISQRAGWLVILFIGEMFTATAMGFFEDEIQKAVVLSLFLPLIISSGGNSGSQSSALVIRAMALSEVTLGDWIKVFRREIISGIGLGSILGAIGFARIAVWHELFPSLYGEHWFLIGVVIFFSLIGVVLWGSLAGAMLPFLLRRLGFDPAKAAAPFVATIVDVTGLVIYFVVAATILRGTLL
ncbi:MAG: magnesium transporter [Verrucomicrobia bacterium]|nr:magnesium transporter [Verrucomicrobiota bacterium]